MMGGVDTRPLEVLRLTPRFLNPIRWLKEVRTPDLKARDTGGVETSFIFLYCKSKHQVHDSKNTLYTQFRYLVRYPAVTF